MRSLLTSISIVCLLCLPWLTVGHSDHYKPSPFGKSYYLHKLSTSFTDTEEVCSTIGGILFQPNSLAEYDWVLANIAPRRSTFWIGAKATSVKPTLFKISDYKWLDGSAIEYPNFESGVITCYSTCCAVYFTTISRPWYVAPCTAATSMICQKPSLEPIKVNRTLDDFSNRMSSLVSVSNETLSAFVTSINDTRHLNTNDRTSVSLEKLASLVALFRQLVQDTNQEYTKSDENLTRFETQTNETIDANRSVIMEVIAARHVTYDRNLTSLESVFNMTTNNLTVFNHRIKQLIVNQSPIVGGQESSASTSTMLMSSVKETMSNLSLTIGSFVTSDGKKADKLITDARQDEIDKELGSFRVTMVSIIIVMFVGLILIIVALVVSIISYKKKTDNIISANVMKQMNSEVLGQT